MNRSCAVLVIVALFLARVVGADDGDDFSNNLFTDLSPLLALFGEQFCKQFMSQSMGWLDHIIFAMGPLGILTALVSAIRVGGHSWLKAVIGRARENRAAVEIELMSSTSQEVCEVWNGAGIVRSLGKPAVCQIIYLGSHKDNEKTFGLHTVPTAVTAGLLKEQATAKQDTPLVHNSNHTHPDIEHPVEGHRNHLRNLLPFRAFQHQHQQAQRLGDEESRPPAAESKTDVHVTSDIVEGPGPKVSSHGSTHRSRGFDPQSGQSRVSLLEQPPRPEVARDSDLDDEIKAGTDPQEGEAPNISINIHGGSKYNELLAGAIFGVLCQTGMLIFTGFSVYHPTFHRKFLKDGEEVPRWGYPTMVLGTTLLTIGMMLSSYVVDRSTRESKYIPQPAGQHASEQTSHREPAFRSLLEFVSMAFHRTRRSGSGPETSPRKRDNIRIMWLQRSHTVSDQVFHSFILFGPHDNGTRNHILTSRRAPDHSDASIHKEDEPTTGSMDFNYDQIVFRIRCILEDRLKFPTFLGVVLGLAGYILQFLGLRALNWSASISQLICMFLMTLWRVWVRRGLIAKPAAQRVLEEHEMDFLALQIASSDDGDFWPNDEDQASPSTSGKYIKWEVITSLDNRCGTGIWSGGLDSSERRPESPSSSSSDESDYVLDYTIHFPSTSSGHYMFGNSKKYYRKVDYGFKMKRRRRGSSARHSSADGAEAAGTGPKVSQLLVTAQLKRPAARAMAIRQRLGYLTYFSGPASSLAIAISDSVEAVMRNQVLFDWSEKGFTASYRRFSWTLNINLGSTRPLEQVQFCVDKDGDTWETNPSQVDAALSLWLYHCHKIEEGELKQQSSGDWLRKEKSTRRALDRILASRDTHGIRDIEWWMGALINGLTPRSGKGKSPQRQSSHANPVAIGFVGAEHSTDQARSVDERGIPLLDTSGNLNTAGTDPATVTTFLSLESALAQHVFMSFLWAIAESVSANKLEQDSTTSVKRAENFHVDDPKSVKTLRLENDVLAGLASTIGQTGLCSLEDAYACIIPPFSHFEKLPNQTVVAFVRNQMRDQERRVHWDAWKVVVDMYTELYRIMRARPHRSGSLGTVGAILLHMCWALAYAGKQKVNQNRNDGLKQLNQLVSQLVGVLDSQCSQPSLSIRSILLQFKELYRVGQDFDDVGLPEAAGYEEEEGADEPALSSWERETKSENTRRAFAILLGHPPIFNKIDTTKARNAHKKLKGDLDPQARDMFNWTPLHYAAARGNSSAVNRLLNMNSNPNAVDIAEWTPLHYAIQATDDESIVRDLPQTGANVDPAGRDGICPLHCAARKVAGKFTDVLLQGGANVDVPDNSGMTPLHWAAYTGSVEPLKALLRRGAYRAARDDYDRTPLHLAALKGEHRAIDRDGRTPLHLAAMRGYQMETAELLKQPSDEPVPELASEDNDRCTPLHLALVFAPEKTASLVFEEFRKSGRDLESPLIAAIIFGRHELVRTIAASVGEHLVRRLLEKVQIIRRYIGKMADFPVDYYEYIVRIMAGSDNSSARTDFYIRECTKIYRSKWDHYRTLCGARDTLHDALGSDEQEREASERDPDVGRYQSPWSHLAPSLDRREVVQKVLQEMRQKELGSGEQESKSEEDDSDEGDLDEGDQRSE
ncbi:hypothetical protein DL769_008034 [Monosporascus sp. CRB-8-3]|nr:hypothetical protein DL769_008034 [Monosporascus sp. CRB-8-3]